MSAFADQTGDRVWRLTAASLLAGVVGGRRTELLALLKRHRRARDRAPADLVHNRAVGIVDGRRMVRLVECADAATATLVARDRARSSGVRPPAADARPAGVVVSG